MIPWGEWVQRQRKLAVTVLAGLGLAAGYGVVVWRPDALEAFKTFAQWDVYLTGAFSAANALTYWTQGKGAPSGGAA